MTALLALHGFTGSPASWDFLPPEGKGPRVIPALVGHAGSGATLQVDDFEGEVDRLATLMPAGFWHVIGYSLGARLALGVALRHPARVSRLTLISGHPGLSSARERQARRESDRAWCELLLTQGLLAFVDAWETQPLWASQVDLARALWARKRAERLSHTAAGLVRSLAVTGLAEMPDYSARLTEITVPVTLIAGQRDPKFSALAEHMAARIAQVELAIIPGAGHDLLLERPTFIADIVQRGAGHE